MTAREVSTLLAKRAQQTGIPAAEALRRARSSLAALNTSRRPAPALTTTTSEAVMRTGGRP